MPTDLQSRTQYLTLARFCQRIISGLFDYIEGTAALPVKTQDQALASLQSVKSGDPYKFVRRAAAALASFEQLRTLEEVWRTGELEVVLRLAAELRNDPGKDAGGKAKAKQLMDLFSRLQTKALWNFEQATQTQSPDLGELCRPLTTA